jgi:predicted esterase
MKPTMGGISNFHFHSPSIIVQKLEKSHITKLCKFYILHGELDATVPITSSIKFAKNLKEIGANVILYEYLIFLFYLFYCFY